MKKLRVLPLVLAVPLTAALGADLAGTEDLRVEAHDVRVLVDGPLISAEVETTILNPTEGTGHAALDLPLPLGAALSGLSTRGPGGEVTGQVVPRTEASSVFSEVSGVDVRPIEETAIEPRAIAPLYGRDPALLERSNGRSLTLRVAPVPALSRKRVALRWAAALEVEGDEARVVVPLARKRASIAGPERPHASLPAVFRAEVLVHSPVPIANVRCASHPATVECVEEGRTYKVTVESKAVLRDIDVRYSYPSSAGWAAVARAGDTALVTVVPCFEGARPARELLMAVETSAAARAHRAELLATLDAALSALEDGERFQLVGFGLAARTCFEEPVLASDETRARARLFVEESRFAAQGDARNVFARAKGGDVLLLATRDLSERGDLLEQAAQAARTSGARVFALELGGGSSRSLEALARTTSGLARSDVRALHAARRTPLLHAPKLTIDGFEAVSEMPALLRSGSALPVLGRAPARGGALSVAVLSGTREDGTAVSMKLSLEPTGPAPVVARLASQERVRSLRAGLARRERDPAARARIAAEIAECELEGQILGARTSLIVLEDDAMFEERKIARTNRDRVRAERAAEADRRAQLSHPHRP